MNHTLTVKFKIKDNLRFLSHQETLSMFKLALVRAGIDICYSEGFNPRPKVSLPLPRSVGVESEDELLCVSVSSAKDEDELGTLKKRISSEMPFGCEISKVEVMRDRVSFQPESSVYAFSPADEYVDRVRDNVESLQQRLSGEAAVVVERQNKNGWGSRSIDVGKYIDSIEFEGDVLLVKCNITPAGAIRIDEIMQLIDIDPGMLSGPVKRKSVKWSNN